MSAVRSCQLTSTSTDDRSADLLRSMKLNLQLTHLMIIGPLQLEVSLRDESDLSLSQKSESLSENWLMQLRMKLIMPQRNYLTVQLLSVSLSADSCQCNYVDITTYKAIYSGCQSYEAIQNVSHMKLFRMSVIWSYSGCQSYEPIQNVSDMTLCSSWNERLSFRAYWLHEVDEVDEVSELLAGHMNVSASA